MDLSKISTLTGSGLSVTGYRNQASGFDPRSGDGARRQGLGVEDLLPRELWLVTATLNKVLDLTDATTLQALGVEPDELVRDGLALTREIGEAAHEHRFQAIRSASVTGVDDVVAIFPENLAGAVMAAELVQEWRTAADLR